MNKRLIVIQIIGDAIFPILGYIFWDWTLYFILLFYLLDMLINEILTQLKINKTRFFQKEGNQNFKALLSILLLLFSVFLIHLAMSYVQTNIDFKKEIISFWNYKDMGIEQGYLLIPMLVLMGVQSYKMEFIKTKKYLQTTCNTIWKQHFISYLFIIGFSGIALGISQFLVLKESIIIMLILLFTSLFKWVFPR